MSDEEKIGVRTRTITWEDPLPAVERAREMSGLEYLRAIQDGRIPAPPIAALVDMRLAEVGEGRAVFELKAAEFHYNPIGSVHGGIAATLLDSAMGCAVNTVLPRGASYTTLELKVNYLRPMTRDTGLVRAEGSVVHMGGRVAVAEGRLVDAAGKLYAHATTTCLVMRG
jgi:uncharacterized protein (TIGR00369 family)